MYVYISRKINRVLLENWRELVIASVRPDRQAITFIDVDRLYHL